jgi:hypothetical protein
MAREKNGSRALFLLVWTVYLLAVFALADAAIVLALFARRDSDATMSISLVLILTSVRDPKKEKKREPSLGRTALTNRRILVSRSCR